MLVDTFTHIIKANKMVRGYLVLQPNIVQNGHFCRNEHEKRGQNKEISPFLQPNSIAVKSL